MDLKEFKEVVAQNIYYLRTKNHLTQYELGEKLNYSDKAISKWERAEGMPDAYIISKMSELFGVTVDYMLTPHSEQDKKVETRPIKKVKRIVSNIVSAGILFIALFIFSIVTMVSDYKEFFWQIFIYAIPVVVVYRIIFNSVWFRAKNVFLLTSILLWSLIASIYVAIANWSLWIIFIIGLPLQVIVFLAFRIKITVRFSKKPKRQKEGTEQAEPTNEQK